MLMVTMLIVTMLMMRMIGDKTTLDKAKHKLLGRNHFFMVSVIDSDN